MPVTVYWIDFKGAHVDKGVIQPNGGTWIQTTWIDHPWIFCAKDEATGEERILLHYIPYRVIPTTAQAPTVDSDDDNNNEPDSKKTGLHQFLVVASSADSIYSCAVDDAVLPHPAAEYIPTPHKAAEFALLHCLRMNYGGWFILKKHLRMIVQHPDKPQYRQIRTANRTFAESVWNTPAMGVLLAAGFVEHVAMDHSHGRCCLSHAAAGDARHNTESSNNRGNNKTRESITRQDGVMDETTIAPYNPSSRRGNVAIHLRVVNDLDNVRRALACQ